MTARPIADNLFESGPRTRLLAGRHRETGRYVFPFPTGYHAESYDLVPLTGDARLWSHTVQRFRPKSPPYTGPAAFEPYAVGYVEFENQMIVEGRLVGLPLDAWQIGMALRPTTIELECSGAAVSLFAFEPVETIA